MENRPRRVTGKDPAELINRAAAIPPLSTFSIGNRRFDIVKWQSSVGVADALQVTITALVAMVPDDDR